MYNNIKLEFVELMNLEKKTEHGFRYNVFHFKGMVKELKETLRIK